MKRSATPIIAGLALAGAALLTAAPAAAQGFFRDDDRSYYGSDRGYRSDRERFERDRDRYGRDQYERGYRMGREDERRHGRGGYRRGYEREDGLFSGGLFGRDGLFGREREFED